MIGPVRCTFAIGIAVAASHAAPLSAQQTGSVVQTRASDRVAAVETALMGRTVSLRLEQVTLRDALAVLAARAGLHLVYAWREVPVDKVVSLVAGNITVRDALSALLQDTGVEPVVSESGQIRLRPSENVPGAEPVHQQTGGVVAGQVTDAATRAPLDQVAVRVEGPGLGAVTTSDGHYALRDVSPGTYRVTARRVGYTPLTKVVTAATDSVVTVNFALAATPTKLNEVVTTAVGDQRRYEVGNVISTINADSIAPTAPITSLTDLISARAPGVQVLETSGMAGSGEAIRIRGLSSLVLQNDPILIVDGVRQDNSPGGDILAYFNASGNSHPTPTRLNDIDFADIESIDILKGPSASTEYGTDAANGVIVITTKHGTAGAPQWRASAEQTESVIPKSFPSGYYSWGHTTDGTHTAVDCPLVAGEGLSAGYARTASNCVVDSVTQWNPLNHSGTSIFGVGSRGKYDVSVSGGSEAARYFAAGGLSNESGMIRMPQIFRRLADTSALGLPASSLNPNSQQQRSIRATTAITLGSRLDLTAAGSYHSTYQQTPDAAFLYVGVLLAPALNGPANYYGYGSSPNSTPIAELTDVGSQNTTRTTGGLTANWRPAGWFVGHATVGLDHAGERNGEINYPLANSAYYYTNPLLGLVDATTDVYSVDLRGTATARVAEGVRAVTSGGLQMVDTRVVGQSAVTYNITATNLTLNGATGATVMQRANRQATLGGYAEEQLSLADRLFLTGALRLDAGSGFGGAYTLAAYPKASVSWLAIDRGPTTLRVRGAFGESGVQPTNGAAMTLYAPSVAYLGGAPVTTYPLNWPGNPALRPERSVEFEGGADVGGWDGRMNLELTGYSKTTRDALVNVSLGGDICCYTYQENIGEVRNVGVEASVTAGLVRSRTVTWDAVVSASVNHNTLVSLAPGVTGQTVNVSPAQERQVAGYPLYGIWARHVSYADANHDGIIEPGEATLADSASYVGPSLPTREASLSTHVGLWRGAVTVGSLLDYRGGYRVANGASEYAAYVGRMREQNDPTTPLWLQARAVANTAGGFNALYVEDGSFLRVREVSVTWALPGAATRALRVHSMSVTGAVRNLALWTGYTGVDPEVSNTGGYNVQLSPTSGGYGVNNDVREDFGAVPLARYWVARLNVGL